MGNFEVGYVNLGVGCVVYQDFIKIIKVIDDGEFEYNLVLMKVVDEVVNKGKVVYIMGLMLLGGVYSYEDYIFVVVKMVVSCGVKKVYLYVFLDGCDIFFQSVQVFLEKVDVLFEELGVGKIVSIIGCYFVMDCDKCWDCV